MAVMFPSQISAASRANRSERMLFDYLKRQLPDDYAVYHGLQYIEPSRAREGEADFLVLHPTKGMLVIECKGAGVSRDEEGRWWRENKYGKRDRIHEGPSNQVLRHVKDLQKKWVGPVAKTFPHYGGKFPLVFGWALAFPMAVWEAINPPPELERELVFDAHDLSNLGDRVQAGMDFHARRFRIDFGGTAPSMSAKDFKRFLTEIVSPEMGIVSRLGPMIAFEKHEMLRLTEAQDRVVRKVKANRLVRVPGGAGTGKTVLAVEVARSLVAKGQKVLLLCFNRNLADHLKKTVESWDEMPGELVATSFHKLCASAGHSLGRPLAPPKDEGAKALQDYWTYEAPLVLLDAIAEGKVGGWDAIIVDEGQDFAASWWETLQSGLKDANKGRVVIFYDPSQTIFEHGGEVPEFPIYPLDENLRNTRAIADVLVQLVDVEMASHPSCPEGEPPVIIEQQGPSKTRRQLEELLDTLIYKQHVTAGQIAILTPHSPRSSILEEATELGAHRIVHAPSDWGEGVLHTTISGFKGLEAEIVIMVSIDPKDVRCSVNARYVGASRARHRLYVFAKGNDWLQP